MWFQFARLAALTAVALALLVVPVVVIAMRSSLEAGTVLIMAGWAILVLVVAAWNGARIYRTYRQGPK